MEKEDIRTIIFKTSYWSFEENETDNQLFIHIGGLTEKNESVHCTVIGFTPFVYLELPKRIKWTPTTCNDLFDYLKLILKSNAPLNFVPIKKDNLYGKKEILTLYLAFPTCQAATSFSTMCMSRKFYIKELDIFDAGEFCVHERNIDPIIKFTCMQDIKLASWIQAKETIIPELKGLEIDDRHFTTADIDLYVYWTDVIQYTQKEIIIVNPKYLSFDIECKSKNHNSKIPDFKIPENKAFQISCIVGRIGEGKDTRTKYLFSLFNPLNIKGVKVLRYSSEGKLALDFISLINDENPDIIFGYNIMKFDWNYLVRRSELITKILPKFQMMSRIIGKKAVILEPKWKSSAYGQQEFKFPDPHGRVQVDVLLEVERNYKLPQYSLNSVAEYFKLGKKEDITPRQLFMIVQTYEEVMPLALKFESGVILKKERVKIKKKIQKILLLRRFPPKNEEPSIKISTIQSPSSSLSDNNNIAEKLSVRDWRDKLLKFTTKEQLIWFLRKGIQLIGIYCVKDSELTVDIAEKLNLWYTMEEMSNCMGIPMSYLHTRGQQIKVVSQIYRQTLEENIIIPAKKKAIETIKYQGATVIEANPGDVNNVICLDFEGLYPSIMINFNICYTTFVEPDDPIPDEECHVLEWQEHIKCIHDPLKRHPKKDRSDILCGNHRYRFKKVVTLPDGTRVNEGLMPRLLRNLLSKRKGVKKEMAKAQAKYDMAIGKATPEDIENYKKWGYEIVEKGSLSPKKLEVLSICIIVLNATQLALKISSNSVAGNTPIPCLVNNELRYMTIEELSDGKWEKDENDNEISKSISDLKVWSDKGFTDVKHVIRHPIKDKLKRIITHTGSVDTTTDHSLLLESGIEISPSEVEIGDKLLHKEVPLPNDSLTEPVYRTISKETIQLHKLKGEWKYKNTIISSELAFVWGLFFAEGTTGSYGDISNTKTSWNICNQDLKLLQRAQKILNKEELELTFKIRDYRKSASVYHLVPTCNNQSGKILEISNKYRKLFYDQRRNKRIPDIILNSPVFIRQSFFMGYYAGDGNRLLKIGVVIQNRGQIGTSGLMYIARSLGYKVSISNPKFDIFRLQLCIEFRNKNILAVKKMKDAPIPRKIEPLKPKIIRNGEKIEFKNGFAMYKGIKIHCERFPRQKLLDSLDNACDMIKERGDIITYHTKNKKVTYKCWNCKRKFTLKLNMANQGRPPRQDHTCECENKNSNKLKEEYIEEEYTEYVYDIETKSHHFAAGVGNLIVHNSCYGAMGAQKGFVPLVEGAASVTAMGRKLIMMCIEYVLKTNPGDVNDYGKAYLVYGDTDSGMITFKDMSTEKSFEHGDLTAKKVSHYLKCFLLGFKENYEIECKSEKVKYRIDKYPRNKLNELSDPLKIHIHQYDACPINVQFENLYKRFLLLTKKRYIAYAVNRKGEIKDIIKKGVVLSRRDNCQYLKDSFKPIVQGILDNKVEEDILFILYDRINKLFTRQISDANLIIYIGIKNIIEYAKKDKKGNYIGKDKEILNPQPEEYDDPRLVYPNIPQVLLSLKLLKRGDEVPANTRLELLYVENKNADYQGEKAEDYTFYRENKAISDLKPDYLHYIEKQLMKPITELLEVKYKHKRIPYEKIEDALERCIKQISNKLLQYRVNEIKKFTVIAVPKGLKEDKGLKENMYIGWKAICKSCLKLKGERCKKHTSKLKPKTYTFTKLDAKVQYILDSASKTKKDTNIKNEFSEIKYPELVNVCKRWKSKSIIDKLYSQYSLKKRTFKKPTQSGEKLKLGTIKNGPTKVILLQKYKGYEKGTFCLLQNIRDISCYGKAKEYLYSIKMPDGKLLEEVERKYFNTFIIKDSTIIKDILGYRKFYKMVVEELNEKFKKKLKKDL